MSEGQSAGEEFRRDVLRVLQNHPGLSHEWRADDCLAFPRSNPNGFEIEVVLEDGMVVVNALGAHEHFQARESSPAEAAEAALGYVRDLLSPGMRIREKRAGRMPYRWTVEILGSDGWARESVTGVLLFNYFGRRSERVYQNDQLPSRLGATG